MISMRWRTLGRRVVGLGWLCGWIALVWLVAAPWRQLGGIVDEMLRWLEWFLLTAGLAVGFTVGGFARDAAEPGSGRTHLALLRYLLLPAALLTAGVVVVLTLLDLRDGTLVAASGFVAYWAGVDLAFGAVPLMEGRPHPWRRPLDARDPDAKTYRRSGDPEDDTWPAPWDQD